MNFDKLTSTHDLAMNYADEALLAQRSGNIRQAMAHFKRAYTLERQAADMLIDADMEPTRSILYRSAATLAMDCGLFRDAEKLVAQGFLGNPPPDIADELRELLEDIHIKRNIQASVQESAPTRFSGTMQVVDSYQRSLFKIRLQDNQLQTIYVTGDIDEYVRKYFGQDVTVSVEYQNGQAFLTTIEPAG